MKIIFGILLTIIFNLSIASSVSPLTIAAGGYCQNIRSGSALPNNGGGSCTDISTDISDTGYQEYDVDFKACPSGETPTILSFANSYYIPGGGSGGTAVGIFYLVKDFTTADASNPCTTSPVSGMEDCYIKQYEYVCDRNGLSNTCKQVNIINFSSTSTIGASYLVVCNKAN